ncbi:MAG: transposase [Flavobacteriaceae bacterium]|nr:transposase [Flavobacteriaceae bacterium]
MMNLFLEQVAKDFKESKIIMQVDQARWHPSKDLKIPENMVLIEQPPYSPELNPVEQIWAEVREKFLDNQLFETLEDLKEQLADGLKEIAEYGKRLTSLTNFPHLRNIIQKAN